MEKNIKTRDSNMELLRLVSMLAIILYHFLVNAVAGNSPSDPSLVKGLQTVMHTGVVCFVLTSGYFGIQPSLRGFFRFWLQCFIFSVAVYLGYCMLNPGIFSAKGLVGSFMALSRSANLWFVPVYACLYLLSPLVNIPLRRASGAQKVLWVVLLAIVSSYFGWLQKADYLVGGKNVVNFILLYSLGDLLRHAFTQKWLQINRMRILAGWLGLGVSVLLTIWILPDGGALQRIVIRTFFPYDSPGLILLSVLMFLFFVSLDFRSRTVNWLAGSAFAIYLLHDNSYSSEYLYSFVRYIHDSVPGGLMLSLCFLALALSIGVVCILIDKTVGPLRGWIEKRVFGVKSVKAADEKITEIINS